MSLRFGDRAMPDYASLVAAYPAEELASPTRSTVPLLAFWAQPESRFAELGARLGLPELSPPQFCFEFPVPVRQGSGKPSFTDLMVLGESAAVAIEGKYTEPPYETVEAWLGSTPSSNRQAVLAGWLQLIAEAVGVNLGVGTVGSYPYQLIHRTASACQPSASHRWVVYQLFSDERVAYYRGHLGNLCHQLGGSLALRFGLLITPPELTPEYLSLKTRWASGERDLSDQVRSGLLSGAFFKFNRVEFSEVLPGGGGIGVAG
jgi:hypothetical protein